MSFQLEEKKNDMFFIIINTQVIIENCDTDLSRCFGFLHDNHLLRIGRLLLSVLEKKSRFRENPIPRNAKDATKFGVQLF